MGEPSTVATTDHDPGKVALRRLRAVTAKRKALEAETLDLFVQLRDVDPPVAYKTIAEAAGHTTEVAVINALRRAGRHVRTRPEA